MPQPYSHITHWLSHATHWLSQVLSRYSYRHFSQAANIVALNFCHCRLCGSGPQPWKSKSWWHRRFALNEGSPPHMPQSCTFLHLIFICLGSWHSNGVRRPQMIAGSSSVMNQGELSISLKCSCDTDDYLVSIRKWIHFWITRRSGYISGSLGEVDTFLDH